MFLPNILITQGYHVYLHVQIIGDNARNRRSSRHERKYVPVKRRKESDVLSCVRIK
ncbi:hypothetical protein GGR07_001507 [Bacteroides pyogenes]|nr:hypothetical protein [Bacteroides pyogenes]SUV36304.1 Uncharacterised protein [Bacteroides pyogenes]